VTSNPSLIEALVAAAKAGDLVAQSIIGGWSTGFAISVAMMVYGLCRS
jgi:hypothetical protein